MNESATVRRRRLNSRASAPIERCITDGPPFDLELEITTARGRRRVVQAIGEPLRSERDMSMPIMDGPTTIIAIKAIDPQARIVGSSGMDSNAKALSAGVHEFVPKPYTAASLLRVIRTVIDARD